MITSSNRFHGYGSLRYVYQHGQTVRGPLTAVKYTLNDRRKVYRLAVVVSKKVSKSAVVRNRIRRKLYEAVRRQSTAITEPYDIVITVFHEQVAQLDGKETDKLVFSQLKQAGIIKPAKRTAA